MPLISENDLYRGLVVTTPTPRTEGAGMPADRLRRLIAGALSVERRLWPRHTHDELGIGVLVVALRRNDLTPGLYRYQPPDRLVAVESDLSKLIDTIRGEYPAASGLLLVCGDLGRAGALAGDHGYGQLLVRVSAVAHAMARTAEPAAAVLRDNHPALTRLVARASGGSLRQLVTVTVGE